MAALRKPRDPSRLVATRGAAESAHNQRAARLLQAEISWSPDGSAELSLTREFIVPPDEGVYMIHDLRGVLYVGQTRNLRRRFIQHDRLRRNRLLRLAMDRPVGVIKFSWRLVHKDDDRTELERQLVAILQPVCNQQLLNTPFA